MDDLVKYVTEQIAFDGSAGTPIDRLWVFVEQFYTRRNLEQILDNAMKGYLWGLLMQSSDIILVLVQGSSSVASSSELIEATDIDLAQLRETHGQNIRLCTTESKQWFALTDHDVDHKQVCRFLAHHSLV
jgi:hypothetical protein